MENKCCPICQSTIDDSTSLAICSTCGAGYHAECVQVVYNRCQNCGGQIVSINTGTNSTTGKYEINFSQSQGTVIGAASVVNQTFAGISRSSLREWWHGILRNHGKFSCYAIFLVLPSDKQTIQYLTEFGKEIDLISGDNCLIIALGGTDFRRSGFDEKFWSLAVRQHVDEGYSVKIANLFDIKLSEFPALMLFKDVRTPEHVVVSLKEMDTLQIANHMRKIFTIVSEAIKKNQDPLKSLYQFKNNEKFQATSKGVISELRNITGKTFEKAIEVWFTTMVK